MANSIGIGSAGGECRDYTGRTIQHAMHFVPPGVDMCKLCICENGHAKVRTSSPFEVIFRYLRGTENGSFVELLVATTKEFCEIERKKK